MSTVIFTIINLWKSQYFMSYLVFSAPYEHHSFRILVFMNSEVDSASRIVWDYMRLGVKPVSADCLIVLGSRDDRVAAYAADLAASREYKTIVISGGIAHRNDLLATRWTETTEAAHFLAVMQQRGLNQTALLETKATNTGENAINSYNLMQKQGIVAKSVLVVTKPYMERRAQATFESQWPDKETAILTTGQTIEFDMYCNIDQPRDTVINIMVGDLQRIIEYPAKGYQSHQVVPAGVYEAFSTLISAGFTERLIK